MAIKNVVVIGGTGNLGPAVVNALVAANFAVTVLSRTSQRPAALNASVKILEADVMNPSSLNSVFQGQDALVLMAGNHNLHLQTAYVDTAIAAGIKYIIPSEFGCDLANPKAATLPVFQAKINLEKHIKAKADEGKVQYTLIRTGPFLDWGIAFGFLVNLKDTTTLYNGGDVPFTATLLSDIGLVVAGVLKAPEQYKNRPVYVHSAQITQKQLVAAAEKVTGKTYPTKASTTQESYDASMKVVKSGEGDIHHAMVGFLMVAIFDEAYGPKFEKTESDAFGIKQLGQADIEQLIAGIVDKK
ncbi:Hypothetical protein D9617_5g069370 [Elsinoe fawcettii]|nr:Hypothetical protein D9617_5g069370 [Elsinoe fawcettii]